MSSMSINEVRELNMEDLVRELSEQKRAFMNLRFNKATQQLSDTSEMNRIRKTVARILTVIREREIVAQFRAGSAEAVSVSPTKEEPTEQDPQSEAEEIKTLKESV